MSDPERPSSEHGEVKALLERRWREAEAGPILSETEFEELSEADIEAVLAEHDAEASPRRGI